MKTPAPACGASVAAVSDDGVTISQQSEFIEYRKKGIPASQVDAKLSEPLIDRVLGERVDILFKFE